MPIDPEKWPAVSRLLDEWLEMPEESREGWLDRLGPEHADLLPALRELVAPAPASRANNNADGFLYRLPTLGATADWTTRTPYPFALPAPGSMVGPYRLIREL